MLFPLCVDQCYILVQLIFHRFNLLAYFLLVLSHVSNMLLI